MITPINFEIAKLLKEKGFDNESAHYYNEKGEMLFDTYFPSLQPTKPDVYYDNPTISEVVMWLYEKHEIFITVTIPYSEFGKFSAEIWGKESDNIKILLVDGMSVFNTINQAYEEGIIEALKLI